MYLIDGSRLLTKKFNPFRAGADEAEDLVGVLFNPII